VDCLNVYCALFEARGGLATRSVWTTLIGLISNESRCSLSRALVRVWRLRPGWD
jgi:hypothetical protein